MQRPPSTVSWGTNPPTPDRTARCRAFADQFAVLPRKKWKTTRRRHFVRHIYAQIDGMCTSNGAAGLVMFLRAVSNQPHKVLCPPTLYEQHSRWGTGSSLDENIEALIETGICDADFAGGEQTRLRDVPDGWRENARRYRLAADEVWNCRGELDAVATAIQCGFAVLIGVRWPGGGGHSVLATDLVCGPNGAVSLEGPNSWGATWNKHGFWALTERQLSSMSGFGAFAARAVVEG